MTVFSAEVPAPCRPFALLPPHFSVFLACETERIPMRRSLAIVALCLALTPEIANAGVRLKIQTLWCKMQDDRSLGTPEQRKKVEALMSKIKLGNGS